MDEPMEPGKRGKDNAPRLTGATLVAHQMGRQTAITSPRPCDRFWQAKAEKTAFPLDFLPRSFQLCNINLHKWNNLYDPRHRRHRPVS